MITLSPILYAKTELGGITARPNSREVMRKAVLGHPVEVFSINDYINLYHVFRRLQASDKRVDKFVLVRRKVGESHWTLFVTESRTDVPAAPLDDAYDPVRGRYKRYAAQLASGIELIFVGKTEAVKARRAWQLHVPVKERQLLKSSVMQVGRTSRYRVAILARDR